MSSVLVARHVFATTASVLHVVAIRRHERVAIVFWNYEYCMAVAMELASQPCLTRVIIWHVDLGLGKGSDDRPQ